MPKRKRKPIVNFYSYTILEFIDLVYVVILNMTSNAFFPTPSPTLASLTTKADELAKAEKKTHGGSPQDTQDMYDQRTVLEHDMEMLGLYIYITADGDETKMLSTKFPLTSEEVAPAKRPIFWLKQGNNPGEILAGCKAVKDARSYMWVYFIGDTAPENIKDYELYDGSTQCKILINDLAGKVRVWVRVKPILPDRSGVWQKALDIMVP
jgi:hypothetical protein